MSAAVLGVATATTVIADPYGDDHLSGTGALPDSVGHAYCYGTFDESVRYIMEATMGYLDFRTDLLDIFDAQCGGGTDVIVDDANLPGTVRGSYSCLVYISTSSTGVDVCDQSRVRVDRAEIADQAGGDAGLTVFNIRKTLCHEVGHSTGMTHYSSSVQNDCMISGSVPYDVIWRKYGSHRTEHVNNTF